MTADGARADIPSPAPEPAGRLDSWKEIASYLKRSVRTATRWEREQGLPVHRQKTGAVYAYTSELDAWWTDHGQQIEGGDPQNASPQGAWLVRYRILLLVVAGMIVAVVLVGLVGRRPTKPEPKLFPLTTFPGAEGPPSLSPDGNQVAFHKNGDIFVKQVGGEALRPLTHSPAVEAMPAWSPDGRYIAFVRDTGVFLISPLGGGEKKIAEIGPPARFDNMRMMAWTADSRWLIVSERTSPIRSSLFQVSIDTGERKRLTSPPEPGIGDYWPAISPDGRMLAFARFPQDSSANVYVMPLAGGEPRQITNERGNLWGLSWTPDGKEVVFSSDRTEVSVSRLWRVPVKSQAGRPPLLVEGSGEDARFPSFSRSGTATSVRLAYQKFQQNWDIRRAEIVGEGTPRHALKSSSPFLPSTKADDDPSFSPDGRKIAFASSRSGAKEIWVSDQDGSDPVALTSMRGPGVAAPRWSPDTRRIAFFAQTGALGAYQNHIIDAMGGAPRLLSSGDLDRDFRPSWSGDGRTIYFGSGRSGTLQIWKMPADGGEPTQLTKGGGGEAFESPDRDLVYYAKIPSEGPGLWSIPVAGGGEVKVLDSPRFGGWAVARKGIYFIDFAVAQDQPRPVKFFGFQDHRLIQIGSVEKNAGPSGIAVSPDSRWLLYTTLESLEADLMLLENFR